MSKIFISYSRKDEIFARLLASDLERMGTTIWIDVEHIPHLADWRNSITEGLEQSDALIVIISPEALESEHVEKEWRYFHGRGKPIIPVMFREVQQLPAELSRIQYIDFQGQKYSAARMMLEVSLKKSGIIWHPKSLQTNAPVLRKRGIELDLAKLVERSRNIRILAVSSARIAGGQYYGLLKNKLSEGCNISIILTNPEAEDALNVWSKFTKWDRTKIDIETALDGYSRLIHNPRLTGQCSVRFIDFYPSYSMVAVEFDDQQGMIRVSYFGYKSTGDLCPQTLLLPHMEWYSYYSDQFDSLWKIGTPYTPLERN